MRRAVVVASATVALLACGLDTQGEGPGGGLGSRDAGVDSAGPGVDSGHVLVDSSAGSDAALSDTASMPDAIAVDAKGDSGGVHDATVMDTSPPPADAHDHDTGSHDAGFTYACGSGVTSDCSMCSGNPVDCIFCSSGGPVGFCAPDGQECFFRAPMGSTTCTCKTAMDCPGADQSCTYVFPVGNLCVSCGEMSTDGNTCKNGKKCDQSSATCK